MIIGVCVFERERRDGGREKKEGEKEYIYKFILGERREDTYFSLVG